MIKHDAEATLLGCLIVTPSHIDSLQDKLTQEGLWGYPPHKLICDKLLELKRDKRDIDAIILKESLTSSQLADIGGASYIATLIASVPERANPESYYSVVYDAKLRRDYMDLGERLIKGAQENDSVESLATAAESIKQRHNSVSGLSISDASDQAIVRLSEEKDAGVDLHYSVKALDEILGGIRRKKLTIVGGKTSHGKTTIARNVIALHNLVTNEKAKILYNGFENVEDIPMAMASALHGIPLTQFTQAHKLSEEQYNRCQQALLSLQQFRDRMVIMGAESLSKVRSVVRSFKPDIVILDYVQRYAEKYSSGDLKRGCSSAASQMQDIALEFNCSSFVLSQIRRLENDRRHAAPEIGDLKESGDLENFADNIILNWWPFREHLDGARDHPRDYRFIIGKNKTGPCLPIAARLDVDTLVIS